MTMMPLGEVFYRGRVAAIQQAVGSQNADGILLLNAPDIVYAAGFVHSPSERPIGFYVPVKGNPILFVPLLEQENAADTWVDDVRVYFEYPGTEDIVKWIVAQCSAKKLLVEGHHTDWWRALKRVRAAHIVKTMRQVKQPEEIRCIEMAARYADYCLEHVRDHAPEIVRGGGTEIDILEACLGATITKMRDELSGQYARRLLGVVGTVHSGPRGALPHGETSTRVPQHGDTLIAGIGASVAGYHAESGATFILGGASAEQMHILEACDACDRAGREALQPGATCESVNTAALAELEKAGLADAIRHRIGHGMGLEGHESPWLAPGDHTLVEPGMVFSSEPGVYRPGIDGYRTINSFIVTADGVSVPSRFLSENSPEQRVLAL